MLYTGLCAWVGAGWNERALWWCSLPLLVMHTCSITSSLYLSPPPSLPPFLSLSPSPLTPLWLLPCRKSCNPVLGGSPGHVTQFVHLHCFEIPKFWTLQHWNNTIIYHECTILQQCWIYYWNAEHTMLSLLRSNEQNVPIGAVYYKISDPLWNPYLLWSYVFWLCKLLEYCNWLGYCAGSLVPRSGASWQVYT